MIIPAIVEDALNSGVLSQEQEVAIYNFLRNYPCTDADLNALEVLLNKLVKREVRYLLPHDLRIRDIDFCELSYPTTACLETLRYSSPHH